MEILQNPTLQIPIFVISLPKSLKKESMEK